MPSEVRHILFRPAEVVQAVKEYHRRMGKALPAGAILHCGPKCDNVSGAVRFCIMFTPDPADGRAPTTPGDAAQRELAIEGPALVAALILHCRDRRIPLPAGADKSLRLFGEQLCLVATINPKQEDLPQPGQLRL